MKNFRRIFESDQGASMVEYGLLVTVIALVALTAVTLVGDKAEATFTGAAESLAADGSPGDDQESDGQGNGGQDDDQDDQGDQDDQDDDQGNGADQGNGDDQGNDDDQGNGDDGGNGDDQGDDNDQQGDDPGEDEEAPGPPSNPTGTTSDLTWWNSTKHGGNGAWKASVSYANETDRHQYLTLEVTRIDERGSRSTVTVNGFYVPANGATTFNHWDNQLSAHKANISGIVEVEVKVTKIATSDQAWQPFSYDVDDDPVRVDPPAIP